MEWFKMYRYAHNGTQRIDWPDGGCYLQQPAVLLEVWRHIEVEIAAYRKEKENV